MSEMSDDEVRARLPEEWHKTWNHARTRNGCCPCIGCQNKLQTQRLCRDLATEIESRAVAEQIVYWLTVIGKKDSQAYEAKLAEERTNRQGLEAERDALADKLKVAEELLETALVGVEIDELKLCHRTMLELKESHIDLLKGELQTQREALTGVRAERDRLRGACIAASNWLHDLPNPPDDDGNPSDPALAELCMVLRHALGLSPGADSREEGEE